MRNCQPQLWHESEHVQLGMNLTDLEVSMNHVVRLLLVALLFALVANFTPAQVQTGTPPFGSFAGSPDVINLGNLNAHLAIPVLHKPGRGTNFTYDLSYDSSIWYPVGSAGTQTWRTVSNWGWHAATEALSGYVTSYQTFSNCYTWTCQSGHCHYQITGTETRSGNWVYHDPFGVPHPFVGTTVVQTGTCGGINRPSFQATATDGSGYTISVANSGGQHTVISKDGANIIAPWQSSAGAGTWTDRNGNQITASSTGAFTDTLGTTALTVTGSGTPSSPVTFTYTAPSGANVSYTMNFTTYSIQTNFGCSGITEYGANGTTTANLVSEIDLPDRSKYTFGYEPTPGHSGFVTGRLASVTLPTGGTITYTYSGGNNGINCSDGSTATLTRATPDGTCSYTQAKGSGILSTTTITDPQGNQTVSNFSGIYETQSQTYQAPSGTLLRTLTICYNNNFTNCPTATVTAPITKRDVYTSFPNLANPGISETYYDAYGNLTEDKEMDYVPTSNGSPYLSDTKITYASLGNINAFRQQVTVTNNAGTIVSQTNYNYDETTPTATSGIAQHTSVSGSRGNLTSVNYPVSGLTSHFTYYDTGSPNTSQDVNGATTTYNYSNNTADCQMAFHTSISEPLGLSRSMTWNCTGGVLTSLTDENNQVTSVTYNDAYYWRPNGETDQLGNQTAIWYQPNPTYCCPWMVASALSFNNGNSVVEDVQYKDGLGRTYVDQHLQGPNSSTLDSVSYSFDSNGRPYSISMPCSIGFAGTCSTPKTTQTYDALNRPLVTTDGGGGTLTNSYSQNDVLVTIGPAPSGEQAKQRQLEYDALGRLTSVCEITSASGSGTCGQTSPQTGYWTKYTYDALGNLLTVTQNAQGGTQQTRNYQYDAMSRLTSETNPESGTKTYVYDTDSTMCGNGAYTSNGDLLKTTDATGNCVMRFYDSLHRITDVGNSNASPCKRFRYDNTNGVLGSKPSGVSVSNPYSGLVEAETDTCAWPITQSSIITDEWFSYTARGEISDEYESTPHSGGYYHTSTTYWPNGVVNSISGPAGYAMSWNVDGEGRVYSTYVSSNILSSTLYNAASQATQVNFGTGDSDSFSYDSNTNRMRQYQFTVNGSSLTGALGWNANGTLQTQNITDAFNSSDTQNCSYAYDDLSRLVGGNCGSAAAQTFSYNADGSGAFGNISKSGSPYSFQPTYSPTTNRITSIGSCTPSYDANGDLTNDCLHTYTWNSYGAPLTIDSVGLTYDALGRMVEQNRSGAYTQIAYSTTGFRIAILNGQSYTTAFVPLGGGVMGVWSTSLGVYIRHPDWLGSSRLASTLNRTILYDGAYAPFGEPYAQSGTADLNFTGIDQDTVSGLYDFPSREYSFTGRWPSPDPAGLAAVDPTTPQSWNRYAYVINNPVALVDPSGMDFCSGNSPYTTGGGGTNNLPNPDCIPTGIPNYFDASYNGPVPDWKYFQGQTWQSVDTWFNNQGITEYAPLPTGLLNYNPNQGDLGMLGSQEMAIGFKQIVKKIQDDWVKYALGENITWAVLANTPLGGGLPLLDILYAIQTDQSVLQGLNGWTLVSVPSVPPAPCSMNAGLAMGVWKAQLLAWIKSHPGQAPPAELATPPSLSGVCG